MEKANRRTHCIRMARRYGAGLLLLGVALGAAAPASADDHAASTVDFRPGSITSVEQADRALAEVGRERAAIEAHYATEEGKCYSRFFATSCVEEAKERRRKSLLQLRPIEQEANTFKRRARVVERDAALQEREQAAAAKQQHSDGAMTPPAGPAATNHAEARPEKPQVIASGTKKPAPQRHHVPAGRTRQQQEDEARKRAQNVAAYERKVREAEARQREVEARKLEKARQREARAAASQAASN